MDDPRSGLPEYNIARSGLYPSLTRPPFDFNGTILRVFPLRARLGRVQDFIDDYLNIVPGEAAEFRAFLPYVYLVFIYYGRMSLDAASLGWIAQHEMVFTIPLLWYRKHRGRFVFKDFAYTSPFIYVDHGHSMSTGREVYGWPKDIVSADTLATSWMKTPEEGTVLAHFSAKVFPELYAGKRLESRPLIEVGRSVGSSFSRFPFNPRWSWLPWVSLPRALAGSVDLMGDTVEALRGMGVLRKQPGSAPETYAGMLAQLSRALRPYGPERVCNTINLKQFRDAEEPNSIAYQALTNAPMEFRRFHRVGLLGDSQLIQGDSSGGYWVDIHHYPTHPIVETLGLEFDEDRTIAGRTVHRLRPVFPAWLEADLRYNLGASIAWRTKRGAWHDGKGPLPSLGQEVSDWRYNTARGAAEPEIEGPFDFPNVTLRVMPLLADREKLETFLVNYLNTPLEGTGIKVEPWGHYVYFVATSYEEMSSEANDIGWWAEREIAFYVPARVKLRGQHWKFVLVPAYAFADSTTATLTGAEVSGLPLAKATLTSPSDMWMHSHGLDRDTQRELLSARTVILPAIGLGQKAEEHVLLEVFEGSPIPTADQALWRSVAEKWGLKLKRELSEKESRTKKDDEDLTLGRWKALHVLAEKEPIQLLTLKQFRDAEHPTKACYQALVELKRHFTHVHHIEEIEGGLYIGIRRFPTHPIVKTLGLIPMTEVVKDGVLTHILEPVRPFWMKVSLKEHPAQNLIVRANTGGWTAPPEREADPSFSSSGGSPLEAFKQMLSTQEPRRVVQYLKESPGANGGGTTMSTDSPQHGYEQIHSLGPQVIVESILSDEWENRKDCRWSRAYERLKRSSHQALQNHRPLEAAKREFNLMRDALLVDPKAWDRAERSDLIKKALEHMAELFCFRLMVCLLKGAILGGRKDSPERRDELDKVFQKKFGELGSTVTELGAADAHPGGAGRREPRREKALIWARGMTQGEREEIRATVDACTQRFRSQVDFDTLPPITRKSSWRDVIQYEQHAEGAREKLLMVLSKLYQKPHHVIRRGTIANPAERERLYPLKDSWDEQWHVVREGPE